MNLNLENKVFFIAGSSKGIGLGIAESFLQEGACVVITGRDKNQLDNAVAKLSALYEKEKIFSLNGDLQHADVMKNFLECVQEKFGRLDGVIANIGSGSEVPGIPEDPEIWERSYQKNVKISILLAQASIPFLSVQGGAFIFISSIAGVEDIAAPIAYSMHKAAVIAASKKLSRLLAPMNIRVNVVAPGNIFFDQGGWSRKKEADSNAVDEYIKSEVPLGIFGSCGDIGNMCVFLSSEKARFITGGTIVIDGGQTRSF